VSFGSHTSIFYYKNYLYSFFPTPEAYGRVTPLIGGTLARGYMLFLAGLANSIRGLNEKPGQGPLAKPKLKCIPLSLPSQ
jgi:hypothetical protein